MKLLTTLDDTEVKVFDIIKEEMGCNNFLYQRGKNPMNPAQDDLEPENLYVGTKEQQRGTSSLDVDRFTIKKNIH